MLTKFHNFPVSKTNQRKREKSKLIFYFISIFILLTRRKAPQAPDSQESAIHKATVKQLLLPAFGHAKIEPKPSQSQPRCF